MSGVTAHSTATKYAPVFNAVSVSEPNAKELALNQTLLKYIGSNSNMALESDEEMIRRDRVLEEVKKIFLKWVHFISMHVLNMPEDEADDAGGEMFISGSHRLGVRDIGADIDTICVAPNFCTRDHFFTHLKNDLLNHPDVKNLNAVEGALVPIISFDFRGVSIDLLFARLSEMSVPKDIDILEDKILVGLDDATEKSLNGPRVTNMIFKLVGENTFPTFLVVLRLIRYWAKARGLYGNKLGYMGGINCNILVAFMCQLYPTACPALLLFQFFKMYSKWPWPKPIMLNEIQMTIPNVPLSAQKDVWQPGNPHEYMPIITPAYPAMNSSFSVSLHSMTVMQQEFKRGYDVLTTIIKKKGKGWDSLFDPSEFFIKYSHYLACHIVGTGDNSDSRGWMGFVESRIRRFTQFPFLESLPLVTPIQLYPKDFPTDKSKKSVCYYIGFKLDTAKIAASSDKSVRIDECGRRFFDSLVDPERGFNGNFVEGLDFYVEHLSWKKLPDSVFAKLGGREAAKTKRQEMGFAPKSKVDSSSSGSSSGSSSSGGGGSSSKGSKSDGAAATDAETPAAAPVPATILAPAPAPAQAPAPAPTITAATAQAAPTASTTSAVTTSATSATKAVTTTTTTTATATKAVTSTETTTVETLIKVESLSETVKPTPPPLPPVAKEEAAMAVKKRKLEDGEGASDNKFSSEMELTTGDGDGDDDGDVDGDVDEGADAELEKKKMEAIMASTKGIRRSLYDGTIPDLLPPTENIMGPWYVTPHVAWELGA